MEILKKMFKNVKLWLGLLLAGALASFLVMRKHVSDG